MILRRTLLAFVVGVVAAASLTAPALAGGEKQGRVESNAEVSNDHPVNVRVEIGGDLDPGLPGTQLAPDANGDTLVELTGLAEDGNGWRDLKNAEFRVTRPDGSAAVDDGQGETAADGKGRQRSFGFAFRLDRDDPPGRYVIEMAVEDVHAAQASSVTTVEVMDYLAFEVEQSALSFGGALGPGTTSHGSPSSVTIRNVGNVQIDISVSSGPLKARDADAALGPERIRYSSLPDMSNERPLSEAGVIDDGFDLLPGLTKLAYFDIHMPTGDEQYVPAGRYEGTITIGGGAG